MIRIKNFHFTFLFLIIVAAGSVVIPSMEKAFAVVITQMSDTTQSYGLSTYSGRSLHAEYVNTSSVLVGKYIDTMKIHLKKGGSPTGNVQIGVFDSNFAVRKLFANLNPSTLITGLYGDNTYSLPSGQAYQIQAGNRIGIEYAGGNSANYVAIMTDQTGTFNGSSSYHTYYNTTTPQWLNFTGVDLSMILSLNDTTKPIITLKGSNPVKVALNSAYMDAGATALDNIDGNLQPTMNSTVNIHKVGNYTVTYNVSDNAHNNATAVTRTVSVINANPVWMADTHGNVAGWGRSLNAPRQIHAEYVSSSSVLVGKYIDSITLELKKTGLPTGTATVGIFNPDKSVKKNFTSINVAANLTGTYTNYTFSLIPSVQAYPIQAGDRIGIKYTGGDSANYVAIMTDQNHTFDGDNSYHTYYTTSWQNFTSADLYMILNDTKPSVILKGSNPVLVALGSTYVDAGATALENNKTNLHPVPTSYVNITKTGIYNVTYNISDSGGKVSTPVTRIVNVTSISPAIRMLTAQKNTTMATYSLRPINAEYVTSSSSLVGKPIDTIVVNLKTGGSANGTALVGVFNTDRSVKKLFGMIDFDAIDGVGQNYTFSLNGTDQPYTIQAGDRIGIKYNDTSSNTANNVDIMTDVRSAFDGSNSYRTYYDTNKWLNDTTRDLFMTLEQSVKTDPPILTPPNYIILATKGTSRGVDTLGTPTVFHNDSPQPLIQNNAPSTFPIGMTIVTWNATDSLGNVGQATQKVIVVSDTYNTKTYNKIAMVQNDDSYKSVNTYGKPIYDKYGIKTTQFIICGKINLASDYLSWPDIKNFFTSGHDIEAHTMTHPHSNHLTQNQLNYEFGTGKLCVNNNMTSVTTWKNITSMALPYGEGFDNKTVINTIIAKGYTFDRANNATTMYLHCNGPGWGESDCRTFNGSSLTTFNQYDIRGFSHNYSIDNLTGTSFATNNTKMFQQFIKEVNVATNNTRVPPTQIPLIYYHRIVIDNSLLGYTLWGTNTVVLDAEMRYLSENGYKIYQVRDLGNNTMNFLYLNN